LTDHNGTRYFLSTSQLVDHICFLDRRSAPMHETPKQTGQKIDQAIDQLNSTWNLQIPRLRGDDANRAGNDIGLARKCSSRIRALCWKDMNLNGVMLEFEERAKIKQSDWVCRQAPSSLSTAVMKVGLC